jgi:hypothetical protein
LDFQCEAMDDASSSTVAVVTTFPDDSLFLATATVAALRRIQPRGVAILYGASDNNVPDISHGPPPVCLVRHTPTRLFQAIGVSQVDLDGSVEAKEALHHAAKIMLRVTGRPER